MLGRVMFVALGIPLAWACGGTVGEPRQEPSQGGTQTGQGGIGVGGAIGAGGKGGTSTGGVTSTYVDPGCPEQPVPEVYTECDPLGDNTDCSMGEGCYPVTEYPTRTCEPEVFQMLCLPSGTAQQWESCSTLTDCANGYTCVVSGDGTMCLKMCDPLADKACPSGLFCDAVDLQGIGICY
jgi:hypothetical protein